MGADWIQIIDRAADFFEIIISPVAILFGVGLGMWILDWVFGRFGGGGYDEQPAQGQAMMQRPRGALGRVRGKRSQRPPTWRDEPHYRTDSWEVLEDRAKTVNNWDGTYK